LIGTLGRQPNLSSNFVGTDSLHELHFLDIYLLIIIINNQPIFKGENIGEMLVKVGLWSIVDSHSYHSCASASNRIYSKILINQIVFLIEHQCNRHELSQNHSLSLLLSKSIFFLYDSFYGGSWIHGFLRICKLVILYWMNVFWKSK
jgi:hypothetical protein